MRAFFQVFPNRDAVRSELEATLNAQAKPGEPKLVLNAFILSPTKFSDLLNVGDPAKKKDLEDRHVLFMEEGGHSYLNQMFSQIH